MAGKITKNISLTPHFERLIDEKVRSGRYQSASEVVREGLRLIEERDADLSETRKRIEAGWQQSERGEGRDGEEVIKAIHQQLLHKANSPKGSKASARARG